MGRLLNGSEGAMSCPVSSRRLLILVEESLEGAVVGGDRRAAKTPE